jgi:hypothetical protein
VTALAGEVVTTFPLSGSIRNDAAAHETPVDV